MFCIVSSGGRAMGGIGPRVSKRWAVIVLAFVGLVAILGMWQPLTTAAQDIGGALACNQVLPLAQKNIASKCNNLDVNQVCYANKTIAVAYPDQGAVNPVTFGQTGDLAPLSAFQSIITSPLNLETDDWGLALLKWQATVPAATAGQAVTIILYVDTTGSGTDTSTTRTSALSAA